MKPSLHIMLPMKRIASILWAGLCAAWLLLAADSQILITVEWLAQHRQDPRLVILDARPEAEYAQGHIRSDI